MLRLGQPHQNQRAWGRWARPRRRPQTRGKGCHTDGTLAPPLPLLGSWLFALLDAQEATAMDRVRARAWLWPWFASPNLREGPRAPTSSLPARYDRFAARQANSDGGRVAVRTSGTGGPRPYSVRRHHRGWRFRRCGAGGAAVGGTGPPRAAAGGGPGLRDPRVDPSRSAGRLADVVAGARLGADRRGRARPGHSLSAWPGDRRLLRRQRHDRPARRAGGLRRVGGAGQR